MPVPDTSPLDEFLAALHLWRWHRRMEGHRVDDPVWGLSPCAWPFKRTRSAVS